MPIKDEVERKAYHKKYNRMYRNSKQGRERNQISRDQPYCKIAAAKRNKEWYLKNKKSKTTGIAA